jgi:hypothetical protein
MVGAIVGDDEGEGSDDEPQPAATTTRDTRATVIKAKTGILDRDMWTS